MISMAHSVEWHYVIETTDCFYIYDKVHDETLVDARCLESWYFIKLLHLGIEHECGKQGNRKSELLFFINFKALIIIAMCLVI